MVCLEYYFVMAPKSIFPSAEETTQQVRAGSASAKVLTSAPALTQGSSELLTTSSRQCSLLASVGICMHVYNLPIKN